MKNIIIVDAFNILYRAHHVNQKLKNTDGFPTGAIHGFLKSLGVAKKHYPNHDFVITMDPFPTSVSKENDGYIITGFNLFNDNSSRRSLYPEYKNNRSAMPDDLQKQLWTLVHILQARGYPVLQGNDVVEADDIIATLAMETSKRGGSAVIFSGDKDLLSMLQYNNIKIFNPNSNSEIGEKEVIEKYGVKPSQMSDYLSLMGDAVDNIPGVSKCGGGTASKWLQKYENIENLLNHADEIKGVVGESLRNSKESLKISQELVKLKTDLTFDYDTCIKRHNVDYLTLYSLLETLELKEILKTMPPKSPEPIL